MSYSDTLKIALAEMAQELGSHGPSGGLEIPRFVTAHVLPMLSFATEATHEYIYEYGGRTEKVPRAPSLDTLVSAGSDWLGFSSPEPLEIDRYLAETKQAPGKGADTRILPANGLAYQPHWFDWRGGGVVLAQWQALIMYGASVVRTHAITAPLTQGECIALVSSMRSFAATMDSVNMRPSTTWGRMALGVRELKTITIDATKEAASLAGEALAGAADVAGDTFGKFLQSFFSAAGLTALAVVAGAIYLLWR